MTIAGIRCPRAALAALVGLTSLCGAARAAPPADFDAATEKVREVLREDGASSTWGADPPAQEIADRGEPFAATVLSGAGHSLLAFDSEGRPLGSRRAYGVHAFSLSPSESRMREIRKSGSMSSGGKRSYGRG